MNMSVFGFERKSTFKTCKECNMVIFKIL